MVMMIEYEQTVNRGMDVRWRKRESLKAWVSVNKYRIWRHKTNKIMQQNKQSPK